MAELTGLKLAPATLAATSVTLIWDKISQAQGYAVFGGPTAPLMRKARQTHVTIEGLLPHHEYRIGVRALGAGISGEISFITPKASHVIDVLQPPYAVDPTGSTKATAALQAAIDDAQAGDTVWLPAGATALSGALWLHSDMTLQIDGVLQGSVDPADYLQNDDPRTDRYAGLIQSRYEGWEMQCFASLLNAGEIDTQDRARVACHDLRIVGSGTIRGGGTALGEAQRALYTDLDLYPEYLSDGRPGRRVRGRLINLSQCRNVELAGLTIAEPPAWTVHMIYCDTITSHGLTIQSRGIENGDGWDPDSSKHCLLFDTTFDTGDDCIAIKSGKNPEGAVLNLPTEDVQVFDVVVLGGNGLAIGSEQSGGVADVLIRDCTVHHSRYGVQLKAHKDRGGYIKRVRVQDCDIDSFTVQSVDYNADGEPAPTRPEIADITVVNTKIGGLQPAIKLLGFDDPEHYLKAITLVDLVVDGGANAKAIELACVDGVTLTNVLTAAGHTPSIDQDPATVLNVKLNE